MMAQTIEELRFCGKVAKIAEKEFGGSFSDDADRKVMREIYAQYIREGEPSDAAAWIRRQLEHLFPCAELRPVWIEAIPQWPFHNGKPMVFVGQIDVGKSRVANELLAPETTLYVFGARESIGEGRWRMEHRVVQQFESLRQCQKKDS